MALPALLYLLEHNDVSQIMCADIQEDKVKKLVSRLADSRLEARFIDLDDVESSAQQIKGFDVLANCANSGFTTDKIHIDRELLATKVALKAGVNYAGLGGPPPSSEQLSPELGEAFKEKGLIGVLGIGEAPGLSQILAQYCIEKLDTTDRVDIFWGARDLAEKEHSRPFYEAFTLGGQRWIVTQKSRRVDDGKVFEDLPRANPQVFTFREPIGKQVVAQTGGEPMLSLHRSYPDIKHLSWKINIDPRVEFFRDIGLLSNEPISVNGQMVSPWELLITLLKQLPPETNKLPRMIAEGRVIVKGTEAGQKITYEISAMPNEKTHQHYWGNGCNGLLMTGMAIAQGVLMIGRGQVKGKGILMPEKAYPADQFLQGLSKAGVVVEVHKTISFS